MSEIDSFYRDLLARTSPARQPGEFLDNEIDYANKIKDLEAQKDFTPVQMPQESTAAEVIKMIGAPVLGSMFGEAGQAASLPAQAGVQQRDQAIQEQVRERIKNKMLTQAQQNAGVQDRIENLQKLMATREAKDLAAAKLLLDQENKAEDRAIRSQQIAQNAELSRGNQDLRRLLMESQLGKMQEARENKMAALEVPGFERTGKILPKVEEAQKFRTAVATSDQLTQKLTRLRELVDQYGSYEYGGPAGQEMASLATEIQLLGKGPELYQLGVLTGPDLSLLQKITADPESLSSLFTRDKTRKAQLDAQLKSIQGKLDSTGKSLGYQRAQPSSFMTKLQQAYDAGLITKEQYEASKGGQ